MKIAKESLKCFSVDQNYEKMLKIQSFAADSRILGSKKVNSMELRPRILRNGVLGTYFSKIQ